jgi:hypothetical protein
MNMKHHLRYLVLAVGFSAVSWGWCRVGVLLYRDGFVNANEEGVSFPDGSFITVAAVWSIILLGIAFGLFWSWKRVLKR